MPKETIASVKARYEEELEAVRSTLAAAVRSASDANEALKAEQKARAAVEARAERLQGCYESAERRFEILRGFIGAGLTDERAAELPGFVRGVIETPTTYTHAEFRMPGAYR